MLDINDQRSELNFRSCKEKGDEGRYRLRVMIETFGAALRATAKYRTRVFLSELANGESRNSGYGTCSRLDAGCRLLELNF